MQEQILLGFWIVFCCFFFSLSSLTHLDCLFVVLLKINVMLIEKTAVGEQRLSQDFSCVSQFLKGPVNNCPMQTIYLW